MNIKNLCIIFECTIKQNLLQKLINKFFIIIVIYERIIQKKLTIMVIKQKKYE